jgi:parvulin-like peptidyl-prolyl cis-trans isomerase-like protein
MRLSSIPCTTELRGGVASPCEGAAKPCALWREPLLHFLLLGAAIFGVYSLVSKHSAAAPGEIVITQGKLENLVTGFTRTWQRPPSEEELKGLIRDYVREELAYREAIAMGLDRDDTIIRRRLRQKLEFLNDDLAAHVEPTDVDLQTFLQSHPDKFKTETTFTFRHVYLNPQAHRATLSRDAARILTELGQASETADLNSFGDPFLLMHQFEKMRLTEVKKMFGDQFAYRLIAMKTRQWEGPVESGYGSHLVFVSERKDGHLPALAEIRSEVQREWANAKRLESEDKLYQVLLQRHTVRIEPLAPRQLAEVR